MAVALLVALANVVEGPYVPGAGCALGAGGSELQHHLAGWAGAGLVANIA